MGNTELVPGPGPDDSTTRQVAEALATPLGEPRAPARAHSTEQRGLTILPGSQFYEGRFGRLFRNLPGFVPDAATIAELAARMVGPAEPPVDGSGGGRNPQLDNPTIPAGYTYFGQFVDHDITFDPVSSLDRANDPDGLHDFRTPRLDLDSVYGTGPDDQPYLYDGTGRFVVDRSRAQFGDLIDLQRAARPGPDGQPVPTVALIGDPRNDENILVAHVQLTMLLFHNAVMDALEDGQFSQYLFSTLPKDRFAEAQRIVRWHYQRAVIDDYLRRICGPQILDSVLHREPLVEGGRPVLQYRPRFYQPRNQAFMPVEFSVAAYRFGHSMIRARYQLNTAPVTSVEIFVPDPASANPLTHLGGHRQLPRFWRIEWRRFFNLPGQDEQVVQFTRKIDTQLAPPLDTLPPDVATGIISLAARNLTRGATMGLPAGEAVADRMGVPRLTYAQLGRPGPTPLWFYILKEAEVVNQGRHLGPVGGRIVAEVLVGLIANDRLSFLSVEPGWQPFLPSRQPGRFTVPDLIQFSGYGLEVPPFNPGPIPPPQA